LFLDFIFSPLYFHKKRKEGARWEEEKDQIHSNRFNIKYRMILFSFDLSFLLCISTEKEKKVQDRKKRKIQFK
jgi:hypothetical protein